MRRLVGAGGKLILCKDAVKLWIEDLLHHLDHGLSKDREDEREGKGKKHAKDLESEGVCSLSDHHNVHKRGVRSVKEDRSQKDERCFGRLL